MKKVLRIFMVLLLISSFSFAETGVLIIQGNGCDIYAGNAVHDEVQTYGYMSDEETDDAYAFYFNACNNAGGADNMLDPVFM